MNVLIYGKENLPKYTEILQKWLPVSTEHKDCENMLLLQHEDKSCCILDPSQKKAAAFAQEQGWMCLTCGFSSYDSLVLSSRIDEQAVVTLQRQLCTLSGNLLEAGDRLIHIQNGINDRDLLLCCGVLMLSDLFIEDEFYI